jgi:hypothetical protein
MVARRDWAKAKKARAIDAGKITTRTPVPGARKCDVCGFQKETVTLTTGYPDGREGLKVHTFCSVAHAHKGGFPWVPLRKENA